MTKKLPELLCPAGSPEALDAAIEGGADAIYLGGASFNARMNATNFGGDALRSAVLRTHTFGIKVYLTLNTLVTDRELPAFVDAAREALRAGVDALIVADLGGAAAIRRALPGVELHASTQMSGHTAQMGRELRDLGFSRMVVARETSAEDLATIMRASPIEVEVFVHGALCVSHSGQCLFSSLVGGRSGNRGECAQPCRLPYCAAGCPSQTGRERYPLSLKDLSLATHLPALIDLGVSSLKIEGRMKTPEYVRDTARIWRRLLDERRGATPREMQELAEIFSRGGFTDAYYTQSIDRRMLGIRSDDDKSVTRARAPFTGLERKIPLELQATVQQSKPISLTVSDGAHRATVTGDVPMAAVNAPLCAEVAERNLTKLGGTPYSVGSWKLALDEGLMLPLSRLNDLRRRALAALQEQLIPPAPIEKPFVAVRPIGKRAPLRSAQFYKAAQITPTARAYFDRIYLPLDRYTETADGVLMPPVIFDRDRDTVSTLLKEAKRRGARYALVGNLGHLELVRRADLTPVGDFRWNITNRSTAALLETLGVTEYLLSPELTLPQMRDVGGGSAAIVYGRIPMMTLEKCVIREIADCRACDEGRVRLADRRGAEFPVLREWQHRNVVYNSLPTGMSDREAALVQAGLCARHFLFTVETAREVDEVIRAHQKGLALPGRVRRIRE